MSLPIPTRPPQWHSHRRLLEQSLSDLHRSPNLSHLKQLHAQLLKSNLHREPFVPPKLISAYSQCHQLTPSIAIFNQVPNPNSLLFNTLIRAFTLNSQPSHAFQTFLQMQRKDGVFADNFTYSFLLKACNGQNGLPNIKMIHTHVVKLGFLADLFVPNSLIDAYSRAGVCGVEAAKKLFDETTDRDLVTWNSMVAGLVRAGELREARTMFAEMPERDIVSWNTMLDGYSKVGEMDEAFKLFERMPERNVVSWSTMVSGYCKVGDMEMARMLFDKMPSKNLVTWTIMVSGYAEKGLAKEASGLLDRMEEAGLELDGATIVSILAGSAESGLLGLGERIHSYIKRSKLKFAARVGNALMDMYSKCGNLHDAWSVFEGMEERNLVSWNSMVQSMAVHGHGDRALELFARMRGEGVRPDSVTFIGVLCACTHIGLVEEGRRYFSSMERDYGVVPQIEHYGCMVDLLGRGGLLKEAFELAKAMPFEANAIIWGTLLGACRIHNNVALAEEAVDRLNRLEPSDAGNYAILSNIYAAAGRWDGVAKARIRMKGTGGQKPAGSSWIELEDSVHEFTVGDRTHPQSGRIFNMIDRLGKHLKQVGYVPKAF